MRSKIVVSSFIIFLYLFLTDIIKGEQGKPCFISRKNRSDVSFTHYVKVSESLWNEYYESVKKSGTRVKIRPGYIPITHSYNTQHPPTKTSGNSDHCSDDPSTPNQPSENRSKPQNCEIWNGANCDRCAVNFFNLGHSCKPCNCNKTGSLITQCDKNGRCDCKNGVIGDQCDNCAPNFCDFGQNGCHPCSCTSLNNCDSAPDVSYCKLNTEGLKCEKCKEGYFNFDEQSQLGCTPCICSGHSTQCESSNGYGQVIIESTFARGTERWSAINLNGDPVTVQQNAFTQNLKINGSGLELSDRLYFVAPDRFLGNQKESYNQEFNFTLRVTGDSLNSSPEDIVLEGAGIKVSQTISGLTSTPREYSFTLNELPSSGWIPTLSPVEFGRLLWHLTAIKIRGTYEIDGVGVLDNVRLKSARRGARGKPAPWVETCTCPEGYKGQFCELCAEGYYHESNEEGSFSKCIPCNCNGHAKTCDTDTGHCFCEDNTMGPQCENCIEGYFGNPLHGTSEDCKPCACSSPEDCLQLSDNNFACRPKFPSSIVFSKAVGRKLMSNQVLTETHAQISALTSEEIENLPEFEFVKEIKLPAHGIRK